MYVPLGKIMVIGVSINSSQGLPRDDSVFCFKCPMNADRTRFSSPMSADSDMMRVNGSRLAIDKIRG